MKTFFSLILLFATFFLPQGCGKIPRNGLLDGQWQLTHIDQRDVKAGRIYWAFQLDLVHWRSYGTHFKAPQPNEGIMGRFHYNGKTLSFTKAYALMRGNDRVITPDDGLDMSPIGVPSIPTTYQIERLDASSMVLRTATGQQLHFRKF